MPLTPHPIYAAPGETAIPGCYHLPAVDTLIRSLSPQAMSENGASEPHVVWRIVIGFGIVLGSIFPLGLSLRVSMPLWASAALLMLSMAMAVTGLSIMLVKMFEDLWHGIQDLFAIHVQVARGHRRDRDAAIQVARSFEPVDIQAAHTRVEGWVKSYEARLPALVAMARPFQLLATIGVGFVVLGKGEAVKLGMNELAAFGCFGAWVILVLLSMLTARERSHTYWMLMILKLAQQIRP